MIYVREIKINDTRNYPGSDVLKSGMVIKCSAVNLLVGDQGCGKSTLLNILQKNTKDVTLTFYDVVHTKGVSTFYFNTEFDNPRIKNPEHYTKPSGEDVGIGYGGALASRFQSHGEVLESFIIGPLERAKNSVIFLDEPESGLSLTNQFRLIDAIDAAVKNGCQLFIATHCLPLIERYDVISLEHDEQMSGKEFVNKILNQIKDGTKANSTRRHEGRNARKEPAKARSSSRSKSSHRQI